MGTASFALANSIITDLSYRAIMSATVAIFFVLLFTILFRRNEFAKQIMFVLLVAIVITASTVLFTTAYFHLQQSIFIFGLVGQ